MAWKIFKLSLKAVSSHKMRSFLTMLGIIIGVMAVVILVSITQSAQSGITDSISDMGSSLITASITDEDYALTIDEVENISSYRSVSDVAPVISTNETVKKGSESNSYSIYGITPSYFNVNETVIQKGREIVQSDIDSKTKVCILGTDAAYDLFGTWNAVNGTVIIGTEKYTVVGVIEEQGDSLVGSDNDKVLIPLTSAEKLTGESGITSFSVKATNENTVEMAKNQISSFLLQKTRDEDTFTVSNQSDVIDTMDTVSDTMSLLIAGIAAISLLVGGIGIMNIMLVSVTERTKEIGIKKAIGVKRKYIMFQFLFEAVLLSVIGAAAGIVLSFIGIELYNIFSDTTAVLSKSMSILSILFCAFMGIVFGIYPAGKASRLQPIDALHS